MSLKFGKFGACSSEAYETAQKYISGVTPYQLNLTIIGTTDVKLYRALWSYTVATHKIQNWLLFVLNPLHTEDVEIKLLKSNKNLWVLSYITKRLSTIEIEKLVKDLKNVKVANTDAYNSLKYTFMGNKRINEYIVKALRTNLHEDVTKFPEADLLDLYYSTLG